MKKPIVQHIVPFLTGLAAAAITHRFTGWWLNSGRGVATTLVVLVAISVALARVRSGSAIQSSVALWIGTMLGMASILFWTGPGTIWPIVLVVAGALSAGAIGLGQLLGDRRPASSDR